MDRQRASAASLAGFDREIGLDATPRHGAPQAPAAARSAHVRPTHEHPVEHRAVTPVSVPVAAPRPTPGPVPSTHVFPASSLSAPGDADDRRARLAEIEARHAVTCPHCTVASGHNRLVFGEGAPDAEVLFVGEAPGETEDRLGRPFVGAAGEKLDEMIRAMGLRREECYVANVLKSRPPGNRTPMPAEVEGCGPFLSEQVLAIRPRVIVTLGGPATQFVCGLATGISRVRGTWQAWHPPAGADCAPIPVMPTYHPAYVLRTYTTQVRGEVWSDLRAVLSRLGRSVAARRDADGT
jgi:DNA polymerase